MFDGTFNSDDGSSIFFQTVINCAVAIGQFGDAQVDLKLRSVRIKTKIRLIFQNKNTAIPVLQAFAQAFFLD